MTDKAERKRDRRTRPPICSSVRLGGQQAAVRKPAKKLQYSNNEGFGRHASGRIGKEKKTRGGKREKYRIARSGKQTPDISLCPTEIRCPDYRVSRRRTTARPASAISSHKPGRMPFLIDSAIS